MTTLFYGRRLSIQDLETMSMSLHNDEDLVEEMCEKWLYITDQDEHLFGKVVEQTDTFAQVRNMPTNIPTDLLIALGDCGLPLKCYYYLIEE